MQLENQLCKLFLRVGTAGYRDTSILSTLEEYDNHRA